MRIFFAIELPEAARAHLVRVMEPLRPQMPRASWTRPRNLHLTLRFVGQFADSELPALCGAAAAVAAGGPLSLSCEELAFLPPRAAARVVSLALGGELPRLLEFQGAIEQVCRQAGCLAEARPYVAHITLARLRQRLSLDGREPLERAAAGLLPGPTFQVSQFVLMQSVLDRSGAIYTPLAHWPL